MISYVFTAYAVQQGPYMCDMRCTAEFALNSNASNYL